MGGTALLPDSWWDWFSATNRCQVGPPPRQGRQPVFGGNGRPCTEEVPPGSDMDRVVFLGDIRPVDEHEGCSVSPASLPLGPEPVLPEIWVALSHQGMAVHQFCPVLGFGDLADDWIVGLIGVGAHGQLREVGVIPRCAGRQPRGGKGASSMR